MPGCPRGFFSIYAVCVWEGPEGAGDGGEGGEKCPLRGSFWRNPRAPVRWVFIPVL